LPALPVIAPPTAPSALIFSRKRHAGHLGQVNVDDVAYIRNWRIALKKCAGAIKGLHAKAGGCYQAAQGLSHRRVIFDHNYGRS
jgi:hypothetical protein